MEDECLEAGFEIYGGGAKSSKAKSNKPPGGSKSGKGESESLRGLGRRRNTIPVVKWKCLSFILMIGTSPLHSSPSAFTHPLSLLHTLSHIL